MPRLPRLASCRRRRALQSKGRRSVGMNAVATADLPLRALVVDGRAGGLARAAGRPPEPTPGSGLLDMARWKEIVDAAAAEPGAPLAVLFFGEANLVTGYRLYYLLRCAV